MGKVKFKPPFRHIHDRSPYHSVGSKDKDFVFFKFFNIIFSEHVLWGENIESFLCCVL